MKRISKILFIGLFSISALHAEIKLPAIFSDNMLLQQNTQVNLWGKAEANKTVSIKARGVSFYQNHS